MRTPRPETAADPAGADARPTLTAIVPVLNERYLVARVPGWWWNGRVVRRTRFSRFRLKVFNALVPLLRRVDRFLPWKGLGLLAVARRG